MGESCVNVNSEWSSGEWEAGCDSSLTFSSQPWLSLGLSPGKAAGVEASCCHVGAEVHHELPGPPGRVHDAQPHLVTRSPGSLGGWGNDTQAHLSTSSLSVTNLRPCTQVNLQPVWHNWSLQGCSPDPLTFLWAQKQQSSYDHPQEVRCLLQRWAEVRASIQPTPWWGGGWLRQGRWAFPLQVCSSLQPLLALKLGTSGCKLFITVDFRENQYGTCTNRK